VDELTAFAREVVLPGEQCATEIDSSCTKFCLEIRASPIHRFGVFAIERIPARRRVIAYTGQRIGVEEAYRRRWRRHNYIFRINSRTLIDGAIGGSGAQFINHSCDPNLEVTGRGFKLWFVSVRSIAASEELTLDYFLDGDAEAPCQCGSGLCRGTMNA
jgi:SET domain-containing protein